MMEYCVLLFDQPEDIDEWHRKLNRMGAEGWDLVVMVPERPETGLFRAIFKRPKVRSTYRGKPI